MEGTDPTQDQEREDEAARTEEQEEQAAGATEGDQGPQVSEQVAQPANGEQAGFDPDRPVRTSPPTPGEQSGVPAIPANEGVEPGDGGGTDSPEESLGGDDTEVESQGA